MVLATILATAVLAKAARGGILQVFLVQATGKAAGRPGALGTIVTPTEVAAPVEERVARVSHFSVFLS